MHFHFVCQTAYAPFMWTPMISEEGKRTVFFPAAFTRSASQPINDSPPATTNVSAELMADPSPRNPIPFPLLQRNRQLECNAKLALDHAPTFKLKILILS